MRRPLARLAAGALTALATASVLVAAAPPAGACQPESCPPPSPVCRLLDSQPKLPHCVPVY